MLTPQVSAIILLASVLLLLVVIPMLDGSKRFARYISLRYTLVALSLIMTFGCILDFSHLSEGSRNIVLMGGLILVGLFVIVRSLEKLKLGNKVIELSAEKGDIKLKTKIENKKDEDPPTNGVHKVFEKVEHEECKTCSEETCECIDLDDERSED